MRRLLLALALLLLPLSGCVSVATTRSEATAAATPEAPAPFESVRQAQGDASALIQLELNRLAAEGGGALTLPPGRYRLENPLHVPKGVALGGSWTAPHHASLRTGTVLLVYTGKGDGEGTPLVSLEPGSAVRGLTFHYPEQSIDALAPYPWTIRIKGMHCTIEDITLVNPWQGLDLGTEWNELHVVRNVFGCPLKTGVYINRCSDIGRIENVHFNPHYWFRDEGDGEPRPDPEKLFNHLVTNADAFVFGRTDWQYVLNTFCYGYRAGYRFIQTPDGVCNGNFLGIGADGCENAILAEQTSPIGLLITNGEFVSLRAANPIQVVATSTNTGLMQFNNCAFWGPVKQIARLEGGTTSFVQCNFHAWDAANEGLPAIESLRGGLIVQNSYFQKVGKQVRLGPFVNCAVITGNIMLGGTSIESAKQSADIKIDGNVKR
jgi:uncharacterized protein YceK